MRNFENNVTSRIIFRMLKPFVRGKIVYTPDAPIINKMMKKLEEDLKIMDKIKDKMKPEENMKRFKRDMKEEMMFMEVSNSK